MHDHPSHLSALARGRPEGEWDRETRWRGLAAISAAMFVSAVDMTIVNVALPDISSDLGASIGELQWVVDGFLVALAGLLVLASGVADRFGRRRVFVLGFGAFGVASALAAIAPSLATLVGARVLMGAAAAFVLPPALSLMAVMFEAEERPRALAVWAMAAGLGVGIGPVLGGVLVNVAGWPAVFLVNVPAVLAVLAIGPGLLPESRRPGAPPLDVVGAALSTVALVGIVLGLIEGVQLGWDSATVLAAFAVGLAAGSAFVAWELRAEHPLLDVRVLRRPHVAAGVGTIVGLYAAFLGTLFLVPQYLQYVQGRSAIVAGLVLLPLAFGSLVLAPYVRPALARFGPRVTIVAGMLIGAVGCAVLLPWGPDTPAAVVALGVLLFGSGLVIAIVPATAVIMDDVPEAQAGDAAAANQLARQVGGALGVAAIGSVFAGVYANRIDGRLAALPESARSAARDSIEDVDRVAERLGAAAPRVLSIADSAFDTAARAGLGLATLAMLLGAVAALWGLRPSTWE